MFMNKIILWSFCCVLAMATSGCATNEFYPLYLEQPLLDVPLSKSDHVIIETNSTDIYDIRVTEVDTASKIIEGTLVFPQTVPDRPRVRIEFDDILSIKKENKENRNSSGAGEVGFGVVYVVFRVFFCLISLGLACF